MPREPLFKASLFIPSLFSSAFTLSHACPRQHLFVLRRAIISSQMEPSSAAAVQGGESRKRKRRKPEKSLLHDRTSRWRSESEQRVYSTKLLNAVVSSSSSSPRNIRAAADRVLALSAKGRTRWSRAILKSRRLRSKCVKKVNKRNPNKSASARTLTSDQFAVVEEVEKRVKVLGRLVPGCRKVSFPSLLEETTDYIAALEMQVRAMAALAQLLGNAAGAPTA